LAPSSCANTPVQAHSFINNEAHVVELTAAWLRGILT
jgi:hypothetical protein